MCGIVGAVAQRDVVDILVEGLRRLEYRGYDSAGVAVVNDSGELQRLRRLAAAAAAWVRLKSWLMRLPRSRFQAVPVSLTPAGLPMVNQASVMPTRMFPAILLWCITVLSRTTPYYATP